MINTKDAFVLGVDTSNYTTSLSLVQGGEVVSNVRRLLTVKHGEKGLRQSDAVFLHIKALPELARKLFDNNLYCPEKLFAVGASFRPRDAEGSYMPCFFAGVSFAEAVSGALKIPLFEFSHQAGHISAAVHSCKNREIFEKDSFFAFHVSGGTTEALLCRYDGKTYLCEKVGGTKDASAGQIVDRAGVCLGLDFPCGKELDKLSQKSSVRLPVCVSMDGAYFSMSGLQNKFEKYIKDGADISDGANFIFRSIASALSKSLAQLRKMYGEKPCIFAGGVMCNSVIRAYLSELENVYFAETSLSSDNACGTALLAYRRLLNAK